MAVIKTVEIVHPDGKEHGTCWINEEDFDKAVHTLANPPRPAKKSGTTRSKPAAKKTAKKSTK